MTTFATIQPTFPENGVTTTDVIEQALELTRQAAMQSDVVVLPESLNALGVTPKNLPFYTAEVTHDLIQHSAHIAAQHHCYIVLSLIVSDEAKKRFNRSIIFDRFGQTIGHFDKVHVPQTEQQTMAIQAGTTWPIFQCDFGRLGIMICYDGCFPESARILTLKGADVICWPSLQRGYTETELDLQVRSHAYFNRSIVVRSSYGTPTSKPRSPGAITGLSCICTAEGTIAASMGTRTGWTCTTIDMHCPPKGYRSFHGEVGCLRQMCLNDRQPQTYQALSSMKNVPAL